MAEKYRKNWKIGPIFQFFGIWAISSPFSIGASFPRFSLFSNFFCRSVSFGVVRPLVYQARTSATLAGCSLEIAILAGKVQAQRKIFNFSICWPLGKRVTQICSDFPVRFLRFWDCETRGLEAGKGFHKSPPPPPPAHQKPPRRPSPPCMGMYRSSYYYEEICSSKFWGGRWGVLGGGFGWQLWKPGVRGFAISEFLVFGNAAICFDLFRFWSDLFLEPMKSNHPNLLFLAFFDFLSFFLCKQFLVFLSVFPFFSHNFRNSA